jgi:stage III sporulation protein AD
MDIMRIVGVAFITAVTAAILRTNKPEMSFAVTVTGIIVILMFLVDSLQNTLKVFSTIASVTGVENGLLKILLKIVGVGYITEFGAGVLNDFGSHSIADKVVLCGKVTIVILSLPVVESLLQLVGGFLKLV